MKTVVNVTSHIHYYPNFYTNEEASSLFDILLQETPWQQDYLTIFGKRYLQPRLTSWYALNQKTYSYSGITMQPHPFTPVLSQSAEKIACSSKTNFNSCLMNLYRDGKDSNGWHADNEPELGINPVIASLSLGAERFFKLKHHNDAALQHKILLEHGSLLLMTGDTQHQWLHTLAKTAKPIGPRINLTFRVIL